jgi:SAM-dependent methyltransferase
LNLSPSLQVSKWVTRYLAHIPKNIGPVLDLACGSGRHTRLLLDAGYDVWSVDKDSALLAPLRVLGATCFEIDLEHEMLDGTLLEGANWPFEKRCFSGVIVTNYLHRPLMPFILDSLNDQGVLIYETFAEGNAQYGRPSNPNFLLRENELLDRFVFEQRLGWGQTCIAYQHAYVNQPKEAVVQSICVKSFLR